MVRFAAWLLSACVLLVPGLNGAPLSAQTQEWRAALEVRIGSVDAPDRTLTWVSQALIGPNGALYIAQPQDRRIRVFDATGKLVRSIGRRGQGPGEFENLSAIGFRNDTLYATDSALRRVSFFSAEGAFLRSVQLASPLIGQPPAIYFPTSPQILLSDGTGLVKPEIPVALVASGSGRVPYLHIGRTGEVIDTLVWQELPAETFEIRSEGNRFFAAKPFPDTRLFHLAADGSGVVIVERARERDATQPQFRVRKIGIAGDTVFARSFAYERAKLEPGAVDHAVDQILARLARRAQAPSRREIEQTLRQLDLVPETAVPVTAVASANDGSIWLRRESDGVSPTLWQVLAPDGTLVAQLRLPAAQQILAIRDDGLVLLELDALDVPYVLRYRIRR
jgi:hypothetical protein